MTNLLVSIAIALLAADGVPVDRVEWLRIMPYNGATGLQHVEDSIYVDPSCEQGCELIALVSFPVTPAPPEQLSENIVGYHKFFAPAAIRVPHAPGRPRIAS
jgi:hypothetical protein